LSNSSRFDRKNLCFFGAVFPETPPKKKTIFTPRHRRRIIKFQVIWFYFFEKNRGVSGVVFSWKLSKIVTNFSLIFRNFTSISRCKHRKKQVCKNCVSGAVFSGVFNLQKTQILPPPPKKIYQKRHVNKKFSAKIFAEKPRCNPVTSQKCTP
jgi:hypothetical protein